MRRLRLIALLRAICGVQAIASRLTRLSLYLVDAARRVAERPGA